MRFEIMFLAVLIAGCSGGNQATESGGSMSQSVKVPYPPPVQEVRKEQPNAKPAKEVNQNVENGGRRKDQSRKHTPPYP